MKIFTGIDIIEIDRFDAGHLANQKFLDKCFTRAEQEYCLALQNPAPHFAARFAAKEAVVKALFGLKISLLYCDIDIRKDENQRPYVVFLSEDKRLSGIQIDISISHSQSYAAASAVVYSDAE